MELTFSEIMITVLAFLFTVILAIQIAMLVRVRRSLTQVGRFMKLMNRVFKEMSRINTQSAVMAVNNQETLKSLRKNSIKTNQRDCCLHCRHRLSFLKIKTEQLEFQYQCNLSKESITLNHYCTKFEIDVESSQSAN